MLPFKCRSLIRPKKTNQNIEEKIYVWQKKVGYERKLLQNYKAKLEAKRVFLLKLNRFRTLEAEYHKNKDEVNVCDWERKINSEDDLIQAYKTKLQIEQNYRSSFLHFKNLEEEYQKLWD